MRYAELHARTNFTFLDGASFPKEMVEQARALGLEALAITDLNGLYGVVEAREALLEVCGLKGRRNEPLLSPRLVYGSELEFDQDRATALVLTREGYANLGRIITDGRGHADKGDFRLPKSTLLENARGLVLLAGGPRSAAMRHLVEGDFLGAERVLGLLQEAFDDRLYVELVRHGAPGDLERSQAMAALARRMKIPTIATNDVHFHVPERKALHDVLRCIRLGLSLDEAGRRLLPNAEAHLKSPLAMGALFKDVPDALERTIEVTGRVSFHLCDIVWRPPAPALPPGTDADTHLARLAHAGLRARLGANAPRHAPKLDYELALVRQLGYAGYFLTMREIVETCERLGILCQGRGSAANSLICFALGITSVHPDTIDMLFERFLSKERNEPPDIDLDIEHERREEILQHVWAKYGRAHAAMVAEVIRYRRRSALKDVGKVLGFSEEQLVRLIRRTDRQLPPIDDNDSPRLRHLLARASEILRFPRHLSIHVGGFILSDTPLAENCPIEPARMPDRTVIQWAKDDVDAMGMFKLDLLALGMLSAIRRTFELVRDAEGLALTLQTTPENDPATYAMLQKADAIGVFQVESRAQLNMLPRLKPKEFYDLVIQVAIIRPGPIQGDMVHPYLRRRDGREPIEYPHPALEPILRRTLGVPLFQEQVMRLAEAVGGYTAGEADQLRRDMAKWDAEGRMKRHHERLLEGMRRNGLEDAYALRVIQQIQGFGAYGFPESHAAAFARLSYVSSYLKAHHPAAFACALLNAQPMGFYSPAVIVADVRRHGVEVRRVDIARSGWESTLEAGALRLGLKLVRGLGEEAGRRIEQARKERAFESVEDLRHRAQVPRPALVSLAAAGAFSHLPDRRQALWAADEPDLGPLFAGRPPPGPAPALPALSRLEELTLDVRHGSVFPGDHPLSLYRPALAKMGVLRAIDLASAPLDRQARVAGLVITRQRPSTTGCVFITLEDETGHADVTLTEGAWARFRDVARSPALLVRGKLQGTGSARSILAGHITPLGDLPHAPSHDFH